MPDPFACRPWLFVGTIPDPDFPLTLSTFAWSEKRLCMEGIACPASRGTPAMLAAASLVYGSCNPNHAAQDLYILAAGDTGTGLGSRAVYERLVDLLPRLKPRGLTFHYLLPDVDWHNRILMLLETLDERPIMAADAGFMYAAKMSGYAAHYDLFTPDIGELAFLADNRAPHPFYTRNFLLADEDRAEELLARAYSFDNAATHMLIKGSIDRYACKGTIVDTIAEPDVPMLEPIGGTGDTLTGIVSALLASGLDMRAACRASLKINRRMGQLARPTPASSIESLLPFLPEAVADALLS